MRLCGIDLETTGLDFDKDHITEIAWIIKDFKDPKALVQRSSLIYPKFDAVSAEITELTKITHRHLVRGGSSFESVVADLEYDLTELEVDYIVAHFGNNFDRPMLLSCMKRNGVEAVKISTMPWLDTKADISYPKGWSTSLRYVAAELGFLNPFPHSALFDVATMLRVLEHYDINEVIARSKEPTLVIRALTKYDDRELAKKARFRWESLGDKTYPKCWVKRIKASELSKEKADVTFEIVIIEEERKTDGSATSNGSTTNVKAKEEIPF